MGSITDKLGIHIAITGEKEMLDISDKVKLVLNGKQIEAYWLGSGCVSTAYAIVNKRCKSGYEVLLLTAKLDYVKEGLARTPVNSVHVPKIRRVGFCWDGVRYKYAYIMPYYRTLYDVPGTHSSREWYSQLQKAKEWYKTPDESPYLCKEEVETANIRKSIKRALLAIIDAATPVYIENGCQGWAGWDLHGGNAMLDNKGNLVLIDVLYTEGKPCPQRHNWR